MPDVSNPPGLTESGDVNHDETQGGTEGNPHTLSAELDDTGVLRAGQLPDLAVTNTSTVTAQSDLTGLDAEQGDVGIVTDDSQAYILTTDDPTVLGNWVVIKSPPAPVDDVFGRTGSVSPQANDYSASQIANFAPTALSAIDAEIVSAATSVSGLDTATSNHIGAANPHTGSASANHGNEAHSSNFAVDGATQPPENHGNGAHIESYITSGEAPVQSVNGQTGAVSISARNWETVDTITTDGFTFFETVANYEAIEIDFFFYTNGNTNFLSEVTLFGPDFRTEEPARLWNEGTGLGSVTPVTGSYRGSVFSNGDDVRVAFRGEAYAQGTSNNTTREDGLLVITDPSNDCKIQIVNVDSEKEIEVVIRGYK